MEVKYRRVHHWQQSGCLSSEHRIKEGDMMCQVPVFQRISVCSCMPYCGLSRCLLPGPRYKWLYFTKWDHSSQNSARLSKLFFLSNSKRGLHSINLLFCLPLYSQLTAFRTRKKCSSDNLTCSHSPLAAPRSALALCGFPFLPWLPWIKNIWGPFCRYRIRQLSLLNNKPTQ